MLTVVPNTSRKPTDQAESWDGQGFNLGPNLPMAVQIDAYEGPVDFSFPWGVWSSSV